MKDSRNVDQVLDEWEIGDSLEEASPLQSLTDIENGLGPVYSRVNVAPGVAKDAGKLYDAIKKGDKKVALKVFKRHESQLSKGSVQGGAERNRCWECPEKSNRPYRYSFPE